MADERADILTNVINEPYELGEKCLHINYYGTKAVTEALIPILQLSKSPRIVNVSSAAGDLTVSSAYMRIYLFLFPYNRLPKLFCYCYSFSLTKR